jgi:hypothetical protein
MGFWSDLTYTVKEGIPRKYQNLWEKDVKWIESSFLHHITNLNNMQVKLCHQFLKKLLKMLDLEQVREFTQLNLQKFIQN